MSVDPTPAGVRARTIGSRSSWHRRRGHWRRSLSARMTAFPSRRVAMLDQNRCLPTLGCRRAKQAGPRCAPRGAASPGAELTRCQLAVGIAPYFNNALSFVLCYGEMIVDDACRIACGTTRRSEGRRSPAGRPGTCGRSAATGHRTHDLVSTGVSTSTMLPSVAGLSGSLHTVTSIVSLRSRSHRAVLLTGVNSRTRCDSGTPRSDRERRARRGAASHTARWRSYLNSRVSEPDRDGRATRRGSSTVLNHKRRQCTGWGCRRFGISGRQGSIWVYSELGSADVQSISARRTPRRDHRARLSSDHPARNRDDPLARTRTGPSCRRDICAERLSRDRGAKQ